MSMRLRILISVFVIFFVLYFIFGAVFTHFEYLYLQNHFAVATNSLVKDLKTSLRLPLAYGDKEEIIDIIMLKLDSPYLKSVKVKRDLDDYIVMIQKDEWDNLSVNEVDEINDDAIYMQLSDIVLYDGSSSGEITLYFTQTPVYYKLRRFIIFYVLQSIILILVMLFFLFIVIRNEVLHPIIDMTRYVSSVLDGEPVPLGKEIKNYELRTLSERIDDLINKGSYEKNE